MFILRMTIAMKGSPVKRKKVASIQEDNGRSLWALNQGSKEMSVPYGGETEIAPLRL